MKSSGARGPTVAKSGKKRGGKGKIKHVITLFFIASAATLGIYYYINSDLNWKNVGLKRLKSAVVDVTGDKKAAKDYNELKKRLAKRQNKTQNKVAEEEKEVERIDAEEKAPAIHQLALELEKGLNQFSSHRNDNPKSLQNEIDRILKDLENQIIDTGETKEVSSGFLGLGSKEVLTKEGKIDNETKKRIEQFKSKYSGFLKSYGHVRTFAQELVTEIQNYADALKGGNEEDIEAAKEKVHLKLREVSQNQGDFNGHLQEVKREINRVHGNLVESLRAQKNLTKKEKSDINEQLIELNNAKETLVQEGAEIDSYFSECNTAVKTLDDHQSNYQVNKK